MSGYRWLLRSSGWLCLEGGKLRNGGGTKVQKSGIQARSKLASGVARCEHGNDTSSFHVKLWTATVCRSPGTPEYGDNGVVGTLHCPDLGKGMTKECLTGLS